MNIFRSPRLAVNLALIGALALSSGLATHSAAKDKPEKPKAKAKANKPPIVFVETEYEFEDAFPGIDLKQPIGIAQVPGDNNRLFILEKTKGIRVITGLDSAQPDSEVFLDLSKPRDGALEPNGECGVLGLAFPADHAKSGRFFVYYSIKIDGQLYQRVSRFLVKKNNPNQADFDSEQPLFTQEDLAGNHNGGDIQFGPDGYLYVAVGDGGSGNDKLDQGNYITKGLHAGILRIDVDKKAGSLPPNAHPAIALDSKGEAFYAIPADNPYVGADSYRGEKVDAKAIRTEFCATGLRNPWRMSFNPKTGALLAGDVGQGLYEEIDVIVKGGDYGWSFREGLHAFEQGPGGTNLPPKFKPIDPVYEYPRTVGMSVTAGAFYHGDKWPQLKGSFLFADYATGRVIALKDTGKAIWEDTTLAQLPGVAGLGIDPRDGEVLFANMGFNKVQRLKKK